MSSLTCSICAEDFSTEPVSCPACNEYACRPCFQTYLLNEPLEPHCLFCRKVYPEHFVTEYTDPAYSKYRGNLLYDAERPHLEQDEPRAASYKDAKIRLSSCFVYGIIYSSSALICGMCVSFKVICTLFRSIRSFRKCSRRPKTLIHPPSQSEVS